MTDQVLSDIKAFAMGEQIILHQKVRMKGEEVKSASGIVLGVEEHGEVPLVGTVVSVGPLVDTDVIDVGDLCLLPAASMNNVPDPRVISGEMARDHKDRLTMFSTHFKNICVVYKK